MGTELNIEDVLQELNTMSHHFFTVAEVAGFMRISYYSVLRLVMSGDITATKIGGQWRIPRKSFAAYLQKQVCSGHNQEKKDSGEERL